MASSSSQTTRAAVAVPPPDDSDFLDSEDEHDEGVSVTGDGLDDAEGFASPSQYSTTSTSVGVSMAKTTTGDLKPAVGIFQMTDNFSFTYFPGHRAPNADRLNGADSGRTVASSALVGSRQPQPFEENKDASVPHIHPHAIVHWLNIDKELVYLNFADDWGPLNVAMFYRFCLHLHHLITTHEEEPGWDSPKPSFHLILYTSSEPRPKANAALLAAMYAMVCGQMSPADAFFPISKLEFAPFRDAGYGRADFHLSIQDILYGVHRAMQEELLDFQKFNLDEYETYEQVVNGDWNWITPNIIAFASPNDREYVASLRNGAKSSKKSKTPFGGGLTRKLDPAFTKTLSYFKEHNIKLVVRLNNPLYDASVFTDEGIDHVEMYFDDGSNPCEEILRDFIRRADAIISSGASIAVHCKAGLGRTGVLIGAYLAYRHGFSAAESIGFMRIMRPGCVVGPQQHFMYQEAPSWIRWKQDDVNRVEMNRLLERQRRELLTSRKRASSGDEEESGGTDVEVDVDIGDSRDAKRRRRSDEQEAEAGPPATPQKNGGKSERESAEADARALPLVKPTPCVGQPRKSPSPSRKKLAQRQAPATIARMGSRSRMASSSRDVNVVDEERQQFDAPPLQVLGEARHTNVQPVLHGIDRIAEEPVFSTLSDRDSREMAKLTSTTPTRISSVERRQHRRSKSAVVEHNDLFIEGWVSPTPPTSAYVSQITPHASPLSHTISPRKDASTHAEEECPSTPTRESVLKGMIGRASPQIRDKYGLRDAGSPQSTPRAKSAAAMPSMDLPSSSSSESAAESAVASAIGSVEPISSGASSASTTSATSQDAQGSDDPDAVVLDKRAASTTSASQGSRSVSSSATFAARRAALKEQGTRQPSNSTRRAVVPSSTRSGTASTTGPARKTSSSSSRSVSGSSATSASGRRVANQTSTTARTATAPYTSRRVTPTTTSNQASSAVHNGTTSAGRVAQARQRFLMQRSANEVVGPASNVPQRPTMKRSRPDLASAIDKEDRPGAVHSTSSTTTTTSASVTRVVNRVGGTVPRFAAGTASSMARSNISGHPHGSGPVHAKVAGGPLLPTASSSRTMMLGRTMRRRRSSMGEADVPM